MTGFGGGFVASIGLAADPGVQAAYEVNTSYVFEASGEAVFCAFVSPVTQVSATLTFYMYATTLSGSPTYKMEVRNGPGSSDPADYPEAGGSALATSSDVSPINNRWSAFTVTVSLTKGQQYFCILYNSHASPSFNRVSWVYKAACDYHNPTINTFLYERGLFVTGYTPNGFSASIIYSSGLGAAVIKFSDGTIIGHPYISSESPASSLNDKGNRISFAENIKVFGHGSIYTNSDLSSFNIYQNDRSIASVSADRWAQERSCTGIYGQTELIKETDYDFVLKIGVSSVYGVIYTMGEAEEDLPVDVLACRPSGVGGYVTGSTPGSYTVDSSKLFPMQIFIEDLIYSSGLAEEDRVLGKAPQRQSASVDSVRNAAVSFSGELDAGELLTGTPTITEDTTSDLVISNKSVSIEELKINGLSVPIGEAVQFTVSGFVSANFPYTIDISCDTDSSPEQTLLGSIVIVEYA